MLVAADAGCTGSAFHRLRHSVVRGLETASEPGGTRWTGGGTAELLRASRSAPVYLEPFLQKTIASPQRGIGRGDTSRKKWVSKVPPTDSRFERRRLLAWPPFHAKPTAEPAVAHTVFLPGTLLRFPISANSASYAGACWQNF